MWMLPWPLAGPAEFANRFNEAMRWVRSDKHPAGTWTEQMVASGTERKQTECPDPCGERTSRRTRLKAELTPSRHSEDLHGDGDTHTVCSSGAVEGAKDRHRFSAKRLSCLRFSSKPASPTAETPRQSSSPTRVSGAIGRRGLLLNCVSSAPPVNRYPLPMHTDLDVGPGESSSQCRVKPVEHAQVSEAVSFRLAVQVRSVGCREWHQCLGAGQ